MANMIQYDTVTYLAENGADVRVINVKGQTALHLACRECHLEIVNI
jgi:ankyrin repeat protein